MLEAPYALLGMLDQRYDDFDDFAETVRGGDWTMLRQNQAERRWALAVATLGGAQVQLGEMGSGNITEGPSWQHGSNIYMPLGGECEQVACGVAIPKNAFAVLEPGSALTLAIMGAHDWCSLFVPNWALDRHPDVDEPSRASAATHCRVTRPSRPLAAQLERSTRSVIATARNYPQFESSIAAVVASAGLLELGARILGAPQPQDAVRPGRPKVSRHEIVRRARAHFEEREHEHVSIADMVAATGVSESTLRVAFRESFGLSPMQYLRLRTLHQVERTLRGAEPDETTVADVLLRHGVWEFGRFAGRYRRLFDELPSETLRRKPS